MKILIIGATGLTGQLLVSQCLEKGFDVSILARKIDCVIDDPRVNVIHGDVLEPETLDGAIKGQDQVLCALGVKLGHNPGVVRTAGTQHIVDAMENHNVKRLVLISTIGVNDSIDNMSFTSKIFLPLIIGKPRLKEAGLQERIVMSSTLDWTIVRPPRLVEEQAESKAVRFSETLKTKFSDVLSRLSLAEFMIEKLNDTSSYSKKITIVNN
jgi:uncharacterized protein YbjT (DUF2867 family)